MKTAKWHGSRISSFNSETTEVNGAYSSRPSKANTVGTTVQGLEVERHLGLQRVLIRFAKAISPWQGAAPGGGDTNG